MNYRKNANLQICIPIYSVESTFEVMLSTAYKSKEIGNNWAGLESFLRDVFRKQIWKTRNKNDDSTIKLLDSSEN